MLGQNALQFINAFEAPDGGFVAVQPAVISQQFRHIRKLEVRGESQPQVVIHAEIKGRIDPPYRLKCPAPKKRGRLHNEIAVVKEPPGAVRFDVHARPDQITGGVDEIRVAINNIDSGMRLEVFHHLAKCARDIRVIGVEPAENVAAEAGEAFVERIGLAVIFLRDPLDAVAKGAENIDAAIGRAAVHHDVIHARPILRQHTFDRVTQKLRRIERRRDN